MAPSDLKRAGILRFEFVGKSDLLEVHVFTSCKFEGVPTETEGVFTSNFIISNSIYQNFFIIRDASCVVCSGSDSV